MSSRAWLRPDVEVLSLCGCYPFAYVLLSPSGAHGFLFAVPFYINTSIRDAESPVPFRLHMVFPVVLIA